MNHRIDRRKLGLPSDQRKHLLTNLQRQFIRHGYVRTTLGRAKELQREVEKLITLTKREDQLDARRRARRVLVGHSSSSPKPTKALLGKTPSEKIPRYKNRPGGYTRLTKIGPRRGDAAPQAVLELVD
jgi:large subunit ribosomal protein L17